MTINQGLNLNEKSSSKKNFGEQDFISVLVIVNEYFNGLYHGDVKQLRKIFHKDAFLKAPELRRSLDEWLSAIAQRPIPAEEGQHFEFKLLSIEIIKNQAMVKLECPFFDHAYVDFLGLLKESGQWLIVNKMYTDLNERVEVG